MARVHEIEEVAEPNRARWLAGQIDEVEKVAIRLRESLDGLTVELSATRIEMRSNANRVILALLGACLVMIASLATYIVTGG